MCFHRVDSTEVTGEAEPTVKMDSLVPQPPGLRHARLFALLLVAL